MNEVEILNKIMQALPQSSQGGNVVINIINTSSPQNNISQSNIILNNDINSAEIERLKNKEMPEFEEFYRNNGGHIIQRIPMYFP